jgi:hypothetical protein
MPDDSDPSGDRFTVKDALDFAEKLATFELQRIDRMHVRFLWFIGIAVTVVLSFLTILGIIGYNNLRSLATEAAAAQLHEEVKKQIDTKLTGQNLPAIVHEEVRSYSAKDLRQQVSQEINEGPLHDQILDVGKREAAALATKKVAEAITPIEKKAQGSVDDLHVQELIFRAGADDAAAFDELTAFQSSGPSRRQELAKREIGDISQRNVAQVGNLNPRVSNLNDCQTISLKSFSTLSVTIRSRAVIACLAWRDEAYSREVRELGLVSPIKIERSAVPHLFDIVLQDPSLAVRGAALRTLNVFFSTSGVTPANGIGLGHLDKQAAQVWWKTNESRYPLLLLFSRARAENFQPLVSFDSVELFYDLEKFRSSAPPADQRAIDMLRAGMLDVASAPPTLPSFFGPTGQDPCQTEKDLLNSVSPEVWRENGAVDQLAYLQRCQPDDKTLSRLVEIATVSQSLAHRYVATRIINKWYGTDQKPLDSVAIKNWFARRNGQK